MADHGGNVRPMLNGGEAQAKGREYRSHWPEILSDAKALGAAQTCEKWAIPSSTWRGWLRKRTDLVAALSPNGQGGTVQMHPTASGVSAMALLAIRWPCEAEVGL